MNTSGAATRDDSGLATSRANHARYRNPLSSATGSGPRNTSGRGGPPGGGAPRHRCLRLLLGHGCQEGVPGVTQVLAEELGQPGRVALVDCLDHLAVLGLSLGPTAERADVER